jgi:hypothetical protein
MLYIAILPEWLLVTLIAFAAFKLTTSLSKTTPYKPPSIFQFIFFITLAQLAASFLPIYFTYESPISWEACRLGMYGRYVSPALLLCEILLIFIIISKQNDKLSSLIVAYKSFVISVLLSTALVSIIFWRSYLRCTV